MFNNKVKQIMNERFGRDRLIALATAVNGMPYVREVDAYYEDGAFYIITYALSGKMQQIAKNSTVAVAGEWFTAHGHAESLGWICDPANKAMADKLTEVFAEWINNGHTNFVDPNTIILRVKLTHGVLFALEKRYDIDFTQEEFQ